MKTKIQTKELEWISFLLQEDFEGRDIIWSQLQNSEIEEFSWPDNFSVKFYVPADVQTFPILNVRVPIIMLCHQPDSGPIVFLIHIIDGKADELEIYTADASLLDVDNVNFENREYRIDSLVKKT